MDGKVHVWLELIGLLPISVYGTGISAHVKLSKQELERHPRKTLQPDTGWRQYVLQSLMYLVIQVVGVQAPVFPDEGPGFLGRVSLRPFAHPWMLPPRGVEQQINMDSYMRLVALLI